MQGKLNRLEVQYKALREKHSFFLFSKKSRFRKRCFLLTRSLCFTIVINACIMANAGKFALDTWIDWQPATGQSGWKQASGDFDFVFCAIFSLEAGLKSVAEGCFIAKESYLRNLFNAMNFLFILGTLLSHFVQDETLLVLKVKIGN
jgi:hypothetical protein